MYKIAHNLLLLFPVLMIFGCSPGTSGPPAGSTASFNTAVFDPAGGNVPLPNILATASATDPLVGRESNMPMTPLEALAYVNLYEMGGNHAVSGLNAPIYIRFQKPVDPATVTSGTVKVFQLGVDSNGLTESDALSFTDISNLFDFKYAAGSTDLHLFPKFPLLPGTRYLYLVTSGVKDATTGGSLCGSFYFETLKATAPLPEGLAALEQIRDNVYVDPGKTVVRLSGYAKVMDDLITVTATTKIVSRADIALLGRFITTGAGYMSTDATNETTKAASRIPVESALRAFAAGTLGKSWVNSVNSTTTIPAAAYWAIAGLPQGDLPPNLGSVVIGAINSADLAIDPVVARNNASAILGDLGGIAGAYNPAAGVVQPFRSSATTLTSYYHVPRTVPFIYLVPTNPNGKVVIFQHGISGYKEQVLAAAGALTTSGYAVVAIDLPLHGKLAVGGHTSGAEWGQDFMAVGAPLAARSNIQQAAFNLNRLEFTLNSGGFVGIPGISAPPTEIKFAGLSFGSIVGAYYLAGNTTQGFLSTPGGRLAYLLQNSLTFGPVVDGGLAAGGIVKNTPAYHNFFQLTQSILDPVDPATMTTPLPLPAGLPSRLSGRIAIQEAIGDQVIPNENTRYFGNALGGRGVLGPAGAAVAPAFKQLGYFGSTSPRVPATFMYTLDSGGALTPKVDFAAALATASAPSEGYFQFDQAGVSHGFLLDPTGSLTATGLAQKQMMYFLNLGVVVDPAAATLP